MRAWFFVVIFAFLSAADINAPVDCNNIFELRKEELLKELDRIDEQRQILEAFKAQVQASYEKSLAELKGKEASINDTAKKIEAQKNEIAAIKAQNEKILNELKSMGENKVAQSYSKMKDAAAADVLSAMDSVDAASIIYALEPKKIAAIMAKMDSNKASELTKMLQAGPPFKKDDPGKLNLPDGNVISE